MTKFTPRQFARALALIRATEEHERIIPNLGRLINAAQIAADANYRARDAMTDVARDPNRLADAIPLFRRADADIQNQIRGRYRMLLQDMIRPVLGGPPRTVDFHALIPAARPYLLAPYLSWTVNGTYPQLDFAHSDPARGLLTYVVSSGVADPALLMAHLPALSAWLGANYQVTASTSTTITLTRRPELPREIPFNSAWLKPGQLMLGIDVATQLPFYVPFDAMTHTLIAGTPGMGKSVFIHALMRSILHSIDKFDRIYAICGQGVAFERYRDLHPKLTVNNDPEHLHQLAADLQSIMADRTKRLVAEKRDKMGDYILVLIDEWGAFNSPESSDKKIKEAHAAFMRNMMHLGKRGRKVGIRLILVIQEPVERDLDPGIRSTLASIVAFRLPLAAHGINLFGEITVPSVPADPRTLPIGRCIYHDGARSTRTLIQVPVVAPPGGRS